MIVQIDTNYKIRLEQGQRSMIIVTYDVYQAADLLENGDLSHRILAQ